MTYRRKQLLIEIKRCKKNLETITDPERRAIINEHIAYLRKWRKTDIDEAFENSVYIPENVMETVNKMHRSDEW
jgi:hypothetical protein